MENIVGMMPAAARLCPRLMDDGGFVNVFEEEEGNRFSLEVTENGLCVFAYRSGKGIRCSLHSAALGADLPVRSVKPEACLLWPLSLSEGKEPVLSVEEDVFSFVCNRRRNADDGGLICGEVMRILKTVFGEQAAREAEKAAVSGRRWVKVRVP
jgi:hypothetical protein